MTFLCAAALTMIAGDRGAVDAAGFARLLQGVHPAINDITFIYEGSTHKLAPEAREPALFQGSYSYRSDGATLLDVFLRKRGDTPTSREIQAILKQRHADRVIVADEASDDTRERKGGPGVLNQPRSAERILFWWYYASLADPAYYDYKQESWERIDGHDCLVVSLSVIPAERAAKLPPQSQRRTKLWIDVDRGLNPLRVEFLRGGQVFMRADNIRLAPYPLGDGSSIWLPVKGEFETFTRQEVATEVITTEPTFQETYTVVDGSVKVNQSLADSHFDVQNAAKASMNADFERRRQAAATARSSKKRGPSFTPAEVKQHLDEALDEADKQSKQLDASAKAKREGTWSIITVTQLSLFIVGILAIAIAVTLKRRH